MQAAKQAKGVPARFDPTTQHRRGMMAKINIARGQLGMNEDDYRQALMDQTGKLSLKDCSEPQLARMLDWMKAKGFQPIQRKGAAQHPMALKARALWISLYHLGVVHNASEQALEAFAKRQLGCERLVWARQSDAFRLIEALKAMAKRAGWAQTNIVNQKAFSPRELQDGLCQAILRRLKEAEAIPADWALHQAAWRLCGIENARELAWSAEDYERLAKALGDQLRPHLAKLAGGERG